MAYDDTNFPYPGREPRPLKRKLTRSLLWPITRFSYLLKHLGPHQKGKPVDDLTLAGRGLYSLLILSSILMALGFRSASESLLVTCFFPYLFGIYPAWLSGK